MTDAPATSRRVERLEQVVHVKADPAKTEVKITRVDARTVTIAVTPRDKSGNFLGPGYASIVQAKLNGEGRLTGPVDREPDRHVRFHRRRASGRTRRRM